MDEKRTAQGFKNEVGGVRGSWNRSAELECLVWQYTYSARHIAKDSGESGNRPDWTVGLREVYLRALLEPDA